MQHGPDDVLKLLRVIETLIAQRDMNIDDNPLRTKLIESQNQRLESILSDAELMK